MSDNLTPKQAARVTLGYAVTKAVRAMETLNNVTPVSALEAVPKYKIDMMRSALHDLGQAVDEAKAAFGRWQR